MNKQTFNQTEKHSWQMVQSDSDLNKVKFPQSLILCYDTYFSHSITNGKHVMQKLHIHLYHLVDDIQLYLSKNLH